MKRKVKLFPLILAFAFLSIIIIALMPTAVYAETEEGDMENYYTIYPSPQEIEYTGGEMTITNNVRIVIGDDIDEVTCDHLYDVLSALDVLACKGAGANGGTTIYIGVYNSGDEADIFARTGAVAFDGYLFEKYDAYLLEVRESVIILLGKDTDAAYYAVTTLGAIISQCEGKSIKKLVIRDWSDVLYRGFIEGYYGIPWTSEERIELMNFGSNFKTNIYIYAPKDDPYHSTNWRGLYSDADLVKLKEQIEAGTRTKTRFAWAIHPFMYNALTAANYSDDLKTVISKFEQLYAAGVRQFVISADDIEISDTTANGIKAQGQLHKNLLNDVAAWVKEKGDCYDLIFVPTAYFSRCTVTPEYYYAGLMDGLDESVQIMWTGERVCSSVSGGNFSQFSTLTGGRKAFMWMNWSVNDYNPQYILAGKGEVFDEKLPSNGETDFSGIVVNPMEHAELSKIAIFAAADYCWNIDAFDCDKSWQAGFNYISEDDSANLKIICSQLTNASTFEDRYFDESEEFADDITAFNEAYSAGKDITTIARSLIAKFENVANACEDYLANASNLKLEEELSPWVNALDILCKTGINYLELAIDRQQNKDIDEQRLKDIDSLYASMDELVAYTLDAVTFNKKAITPKVCLSRLAPFVSELISNVGDEIKLELGMDVGTIYKGMGGIYEGDIANITDGNESTYTWFDSYPVNGSYVRIDLHEVTTVNTIRVVTGNGAGNDTWVGAVVEYSVDGKTYIEVGTISKAVNEFTTGGVQARYIRLRETSEKCSTWVAIKEVSVK